MTYNVFSGTLNPTQSINQYAAASRPEVTPATSWSQIRRQNSCASGSGRPALFQSLLKLWFHVKV